MADSNKTMIRRGVSTVAEVETAINEKAREEYVDAQDATVLTAAKEYADTQCAAVQDASKTYTDEQIATRETPAGSQSKADAAFEKAQNYTDEIASRKADAGATLSALAAKVDKAEGQDLMTPEERAKLAGIETGANAYTHPESHPADMITDTETKVVMTAAERTKLSGIEAGANAYALPVATADTLGGVKAGDNVTITEDGTISAAAAPYQLPKASATVLGGVKIGNNLSIREDGTLDATGEGTVSVSPDTGNAIQQRDNGLFVPASGGGGNSVLVLPYVAAERDEQGNITNSAAFVSAWGGILAQYLAAPERYALYMEIDGGGGIMLRIPCTVVNMGGDQTQVQWLVSGFGVVDIPASATGSVSCKATCMAAVVCNPEGEMQSVVLYTLSGIMSTNGEPNLLPASPVILDGNSAFGSDPEVAKSALQPIIDALRIVPSSLVLMSQGGWCFPVNVTKWMSDIHPNGSKYILLYSTPGIYGADTNGIDGMTAYVITCDTDQDGKVQAVSATNHSTNLASKEYVTEGLAEKFGTIGNDIDANQLIQGSGYSYTKNTPAHGTVASFSGLGDRAYGVLQLACDNQAVNDARFWLRNNNQQGFTPWRELWHSGNFNPTACFQSSIAHVTSETAKTLTQSGSYINKDNTNWSGSLLHFQIGGSLSAIQIRTPGGGSHHTTIRFQTDGSASHWSDWYTLYHSGNLPVATAYAPGLMSAEDKIKLNSLASAMSLSLVVDAEDTPTTLALSGEDEAAERTESAGPKTVVTPEIRVRAQRAARYQMQTDELLYDAWETFARNHPEHSEFSAWLEAKDRIRRELPKPQEGGGE